MEPGDVGIGSSSIKVLAKELEIVNESVIKSLLKNTNCSNTELLYQTTSFHNCVAVSSLLFRLQHFYNKPYR